MILPCHRAGPIVLRPITAQVGELAKFRRIAWLVLLVTVWPVYAGDMDQQLDQAHDFSSRGRWR